MDIAVKDAAANREVDKAVDIYDPSSLNTICPALILAPNRKDKVRGRTEILTVSINTKKGFNQSGAPSGRSFPINCFFWCINLESMIDSHSGSPIDSVNSRWVETLNEYGIIPIKLIKINIINKLVISIVYPFILVLFVRISWLYIIMRGEVINDDGRFLEIQVYEDTIRNSIRGRERIIIDEDISIYLYSNTSNEEKILGIIKIWI